jgi:hypothetical protein
MIDETTNSQNQINTIEGRLRLVEDKQAIHDVIVRYCRGVDRSDPDLVLAAFHDDAIDNHFGVVLPFREAIGTLKAARSGGGSPPSKTTSMHNICNVLIEARRRHRPMRIVRDRDCQNSERWRRHRLDARGTVRGPL